MDPLAGAVCTLAENPVGMASAVRMSTNAY
jgi:hypothetical protein